MNPVERNVVFRIILGNGNLKNKIALHTQSDRTTPDYELYIKPKHFKYML